MALSATTRPAAGLVLLVILGTACSGAEGEPRSSWGQGPWMGAPDGVVYRGHVRVLGTDPDSVQVSTSLWNRSAQPVQLITGVCAAWVRVYRSPKRSGRPVWDSRWRRGGNCEAIGILSDLASGESIAADTEAFVLSIPVSELVGLFPFPRRYYFTITPDVAGAPDLPAGDVRLGW